MGSTSASCCATCRKPVPESAVHRPFCSARCKMVDLGRWFHEEYFVPGEPAIALEGLEGFGFLEGVELPDYEEGDPDERDA